MMLIASCGSTQTPVITVPVITTPVQSSPSEEPQVSTVPVSASGQQLAIYYGLDVKWLNMRYGYEDTIIYERGSKDELFTVHVRLLRAGDGAWKAGYCDDTGEIVIPLQFDQAYSFIDGLAAVSQNGKSLIIDTTGNIVFDGSEYDFVHPLSGKFLSVYKDRKSSVVDLQGTGILPVQAESIGLLENGLFIAFDGEFVQPRLARLYDKQGNLITKNDYETIYSVEHEDDPMAAERGGMWGFLDRTGREITAFDFLAHDFRLFSEGLAAVAQDGKWGYIDQEGTLVIPCSYDYAYSFENGYALVELEGKYGYIDKDGKVLIPCIYDYAESFIDGIAVTAKHMGEEKVYSAIDHQGNVIFESADFEIMHTYTSPFFAARVPGVYGANGNHLYALLDAQGNRLTEFAYGGITGYQDGLFITYDDDSIIRKMGVINRYGSEIVPAIFDVLEIIDDKSCIVSIISGDYLTQNHYAGVLLLPADAATRRP
ncbi:MAG: WG repeat-containing protein [Symbiobacteriaceae bacterium]|nr:WG repeat-containing protein [Symbiobacteriaceae bacterium]